MGVSITLTSFGSLTVLITNIEEEKSIVLFIPSDSIIYVDISDTGKHS